MPDDDSIPPDAPEPTEPAASDAPTGWNNRGVWGWALYDWANSAYAVIILAAVFPIFYESYFSPVPPDIMASGDTDAIREIQAQTTARLGYTNGIASLFAALLAPILGAIADHSGRRKAMLLAFMAIGAASTVALALVSQGMWVAASAVYIASGIGFAGGNVFYDGLLVRVSHPKDRDMVSALGFSAGYLASGLVLALCAFMIAKPDVVGLADGTVAVKASFVIVGLWWALFTIPLMIWTGPDEPNPEFRLGSAVSHSLREVGRTLKSLPGDRPIMLFLIAYWLYIDGVDTIIRMATNYGKTLGMEDSSMLVALLVTQFVAFPAALLFGLVGKWIGTKNGLLLGVGLYCLLTIGAFFMREGRTADFMALAVGVGLIQGGVQALSRSMFSRLVPAKRASEYFGLYNLLGKSAAILGPVLMGAIASATGNIRYGILSLIALFISGGLVLLAVPATTPAKAD